MNVDNLKKYDEIIVIGHKTVDTDTILSSMLLSNIFNYFGINAKYGTIGNEEISSKTKEMIKDFNYQPTVINNEDIAKHKYFLVDHNDVSQSIKDENLVIGFIDHHIGKKYNNYSYFTNRRSTTLGIYELFKNQYQFNDKEKQMILLGFLDDTRFGMIRTIDNEDMNLIYSINPNIDFKKYRDTYFKEDDISNMDYAFKNTKLKEYSIDSYNFKSTAIERYGIEHLDDYKNFIFNNEDNIFGMWLDFENNRTYVFIKYNNVYNELNYNKLVSRSEVVLKDVIDYIRSLDEKNI